MELEFRINDVNVQHPLGWDALKLTLERHDQFHGIIEYVDTDFIWIGDAAELIITTLNTTGPDSVLLLKIYWRGDQIYTGRLDLKLTEIIHFGHPVKVKCPVIQTNNWTAFINNKTTEYNISVNTEVNLPAQMIPYRYEIEQKIAWDTSSFSIGTTLYLIHHFEAVVDEFQVQQYGMNVSTENPVDLRKYFFKVKYPGTYEINYAPLIRVSSNPSNTMTLKWYYAINDTITQIGTTANSASGEIELLRNLSITLNLNTGDEIYFFGILQRTGGTHNDFVWRSWNNYPAFPPFFPDPYNLYTTLTIEAQTFDDNSKAKGLSIQNLFTNLIIKTGGGTPVYEPGMDLNYYIFKGKNLRGFETEINISFDKAFTAFSALVPTGLWYDGSIIRLDRAENFYKNSLSTELTSDLATVIKVDNSKIFNICNFGYQRWESESPGGVNEVHGRVTYTAELRASGTSLDKRSEFVASSYAIEHTRRQRIEKEKDWRLDENVFIIHTSGVNPVKAIDSGLPYFPQHATHYNTKLIPNENFKRWLPFLSTVQDHGVVFVFSANEATVRPGDKNNIHMSGKLHTYMMLNCTVTIDYQQYSEIKNKRHEYLRIHTSNNSYDIYINKLEFELFSGKAKIIGYLK